MLSLLRLENSETLNPVSSKIHTISFSSCVLQALANRFASSGVSGSRLYWYDMSHIMKDCDKLSQYIFCVYRKIRTYEKLKQGSVVFLGGEGDKQNLCN